MQPSIMYQLVWSNGLFAVAPTYKLNASMCVSVGINRLRHTSHLGLRQPWRKVILCCLVTSSSFNITVNQTCGIRDENLNQHLRQKLMFDNVKRGRFVLHWDRLWGGYFVRPCEIKHEKGPCYSPNVKSWSTVRSVWQLLSTPRSLS